MVSISIAIKAWLSAEQFWILIIYVSVDTVFDFIEEVRQRFPAVIFDPLDIG